MKKILYIIPELHRGGAQTVLLNLVKYTHSQNYLNYIMQFDAKDEIIDEFYKYSEKIITCSNDDKGKEAFDEIKKLSPDLINTHIPISRFRLLYNLKKLKIPIIATIHTNRKKGKSSLILKLKYFLFQFLVNKLVFVADYSKECFISYYHNFKSKCTTIHNGLDILPSTTKVSDKDLDRYFEPGYFHVITVANLHRFKGYQYSIPAVHELIKSGYKIKYHILGKTIKHNTEKDIKPWIDNYISENKLEDSILLHGQTSDVESYLKRSDVYVLASEVELLSMAILGALATGTPVISTDAGGTREIIGLNNEYGILIKPFSVDAVVEAIKMVYNDRACLNKLNSQSIKRSKDFTNEVMGQKYLKLFKDYL